MSDYTDLIKRLRSQVITQDAWGREAVYLRGAYPDDNDHYDAARLMEAAAEALDALSVPSEAAMIKRLWESLAMCLTAMKMSADMTEREFNNTRLVKRVRQDLEDSANLQDGSLAK